MNNKRYIFRLIAIHLMKIRFAFSVLFIVACANTTSEKPSREHLKQSINFGEKKAEIQSLLNSITTKDLHTLVYKIASDTFNGRLAGSEGYDKLCSYLKDYYQSKNINSTNTYPEYYQSLSKSALPKKVNTTQNVIAVIEGTEYPDEHIIISAHSDHLGVKKDNIYYGADDNASGTAAVLEIAEAFKIAVLNGNPPKRSLVFAHFTAEENGLLGSKFYTKKPAYPLKNTVANLNIDMIGRIDEMHNNNSDYIYLIGSDRISLELDAIAQKANSTFPKLELDYAYNDPDDPNRYYYRSDHYNFAKKGIPSIFFFNGSHKDYHKSTDTADKINFELLKKRTDLVFSIAWYLANATKPLSRSL